MKKICLLNNIEKVYRLLKKSKVAAFLFPRQVRDDLEILQKDVKTYYTKKLLQSVCIILVLLGILLLGIRSVYQAKKVSVTELERSNPGEEKQAVSLRIGGSDIYKLEVAPYELSEEEAKKMFDDFTTEITNYVLGNNVTAMEITENLRLVEKVEPYPFQIIWESEKEHIIDNVGNVYRENLLEDELVKLTAICTYMEYQWETDFYVQVCRETLSEDEAFKRNLNKYLVEDEKSKRFSKVWELPADFQGTELQYRPVKKWDKLILLMGLVCITGIALWIGSDKDLHNERKKRQLLFEEAYLNFVSSLALYLSAGLNLQTTMKYCVNDYAVKKPPGHILREVLSEYEKDISNGYSFQGALELFASRADHLYYRRLCGLLQQGQLNGTNHLASVLELEVENIREDKRRQCKIKGEKMSSALIAPMMLQLCIVIVFIMLPAFSNMQF